MEYQAAEEPFFAFIHAYTSIYLPEILSMFLPVLLIVFRVKLADILPDSVGQVRQQVAPFPKALICICDYAAF